VFEGRIYSDFACAKCVDLVTVKSDVLVLSKRYFRVDVMLRFSVVEMLLSCWRNVTF